MGKKSVGDRRSGGDEMADNVEAAMKDGMGDNKTTNKNKANKEMANIRLRITAEDIYAHKRGIMTAVSRWSKDKAFQEDIVQELAIKSTLKPFWFDPAKGYAANENKIETYLKQAARNMVMDNFRKAKRHPITYLDGRTLAEEFSEDEFSEDQAYATTWGYHDRARDKQLDIIERGIKTMCRRYPSQKGNDAFVMFMFPKDDKKPRAKVIARELGVTEGFVNVAVKRGKERLRKIVEEMMEKEEKREAC